MVVYPLFIDYSLSKFNIQYSMLAFHKGQGKSQDFPFDLMLKKNSFFVGIKPQPE